MKKYLLSITVLIILFLFSCTGQYSPMNTKYPSMDDYLVSMNLKTTENHDVIVCSGYNCNTITQINFSEDDIYDIKKIFKEVNGRTPYIERQMISAAIATMEVITGDIVGTKNDKGGVLNDPILLRVAEDEFWFSLSDSDIMFFLQGVNHDKKFNVKIDEIDVAQIGRAHV